uniref:DNA polymerase delta subunit 3 n=1 Tax=Mola mola TaxID=94237 RepID=A0A3Q3WLK4_MOLML
MDELYLDNIDEYVNDHNKIVTYKWLSLTLGVHVNTAKQMLYHYLDHKRKETSARLNATYLVSGKFVDNGKIMSPGLFSFADFKSKMSLIVSVHVYSVQKALLKDSGPLYSVDYDAVKDNLKNCSKYSAIRCASAVPMSSLELQQARETHRAPTPEPEHKKPSINGQANAAPKASTKPKGIMGMFANKTAPKTQENGKDMKSEQKEDAAAVDPPKSKPAAKANPMANYFSAQTASVCVCVCVCYFGLHHHDYPKRLIIYLDFMGSEFKVIFRTDRSSICLKTYLKCFFLCRSKTKRAEDSDSEEEKMEKKKRRRIKRPEPDSSDEDGELLYFYFVLLNSCPESLRFLFFYSCPAVTEKAYESESYSETEDDFQATKQVPKDPFPARLPAGNKQDEKKSQKKPSSNANKGTKQASIVGFFQKK